jgi:hypothetical protein
MGEERRIRRIAAVSATVRQAVVRVARELDELRQDGWDVPKNVRIDVKELESALRYLATPVWPDDLLIDGDVLLRRRATPKA